MKRLTNLQKQFLDNLLSAVHDYKEWDDLNCSEIIALRLMCRGDDMNLPKLVNRFMDNWWREYEKNRSYND